MKKYLIILILIFINSCRWFEGADTTYFSMTNFKIPEGSPSFKKGYKDGCSTALYSRGNTFYRTKYKYSFDTKMIDNEEYRFAFARAYGYCFSRYVSSTGGGRGSFDRYLFPYKAANGFADTGFDMSARNWNSTWGTGTFQDIDNSPLGGSIVPNGGFNGIFDVWGRGSGALSGDPLWSGGSKGQFFGQ